MAHGILKLLNNLIDAYDTDLVITKCVKKPGEDTLYDVKKEFLAEYKHYGENEHIDDFKKDVEVNARNNIARTVVVKADRLVSALSAKALCSGQVKPDILFREFS